MEASRKRSQHYYWRVLVLILLLSGTYGMYLLSQVDDPRFHYFLTTKVGHALARAFGWQQDLGIGLPWDRPEQEWDTEEQLLHSRWENELIQQVPLHRLYLDDSSALDGRLVSANGRTVEFQEAVGEGGLTQSYPRERMLNLEALPRPAHQVTYRDLKFRQSLPEYLFLKRAPYTVATDGPEEEIREALQALRSRHRELSTVFAELVRHPPVRTDLPVVFCSRERAFRAFQEQFAPESQHVTGFYVPWLDRLFLLNFDSLSSQIDVLDRVLRVETRRSEILSRQSSRHAVDAQWNMEHLELLRAIARQETLATVRHEGAHQFFCNTGVHSSFRAENEWLAEGLATWCETPVLGEPQPERVELLRGLRRDNRLPSLPSLVNARRFSQLDERPDVLYALSWLLADWLMQTDRKEAFFRYICWLRDPASLQAVSTKPAWPLFLQATGLPAETVEQGVWNHLTALADSVRPPLPDAG